MTNSIPTRALTFRDLCVHYGDLTAVQGIGLEIAPGEIVAILGPSGAGKTSILAALTGVIPCTGTILYGTTNVTHTPPRDRRFANVYQDFRLFEWMTVFENVAYPCRARGWLSEQVTRAVTEILDRMEMSALSNRRARSLSGGQAQRVALARALIFEPRALFLDEPFSDLDRPLRQRLVDEVVTDARARRLPTLIVTHDGREAMTIADRIAVLIDGEIRQCDRPQAVMNNPIDKDVTAYLGLK